MKLDHIVINASDLEASLPWYEVLLPLIGFSKSRDHVFGNDDGLFIYLRQASESHHTYQRFGPGINHFGVVAENVDRIQSVRDAMIGAGFDAPELQTFPDGKAVFFADADGFRIEIGCYD